MTQEIPFIKMHGLGNDFVIIDQRIFKYALDVNKIKKISDRKLGVGCDQLILIDNSENANISMQIYNKDGSIVGACGNGTRCVAYLIMDEAGSEFVTIETIAGVLEAKLYTNGEVSVNLGVPKTSWYDIPVISEMDTNYIDIVIDDLKYPYAVNVGNPHIVFFVENLDEVEIEELGPSIENHYYFPEKVNVNFVEIIDRNNIKLRTFERGAGLTLACGTGASASVWAATCRDLTGNEVNVIQDGGNLLIKKLPNNSIEMRGKIEKSFVGVMEI